LYICHEVTTPFNPGYLTRDLIEKAKNLKLWWVLMDELNIRVAMSTYSDSVTAGVGSDHVDINAAAEKGVQVLEVSDSNVTSVAEHVVMSFLLLVRDFVPAHEMIERGDWQVSEIGGCQPFSLSHAISWAYFDITYFLTNSCNAFDLEGKVIGTIGTGRIGYGYRVLQRLKPFNPKELLYYDNAALPEAAVQSVGARRIEDLKEIVSQCDIITVNVPLHEGTLGLVNDDLLKYFEKGAWLVNTARGAICDKDTIAEAVKSGQLRGYAGDVWSV
jgi:formate dehydrogenase